MMIKQKFSDIGQMLLRQKKYLNASPLNASH